MPAYPSLSNPDSSRRTLSFDTAWRAPQSTYVPSLDGLGCGLPDGLLIECTQFGLKDASLVRSQAFIDGKWVDAKDGGVIKVISEYCYPTPLFQRRVLLGYTTLIVCVDPATAEELGTVPELGLEETKQAIDAASTAFKTWSKTAAKVRIYAVSWFTLPQTFAMAYRNDTIFS